MKRIKLSVALAVFNEQDNLEKCLVAVQTIADEIIIVDGGSTDHTVNIAKRFATKVIQTTNPAIFHINKQKAVDACTGEWILQLDADEVVTPALANQIQSLVQKNVKPQLNDKQKSLFAKHQSQVLGQSVEPELINTKNEVAYFIPRLNYFLGSFLKYGGVYPDGVIRLFQRNMAFFPCKDVHEQIEVKGNIGWLPEPLQHFSDPTFSRYLQRANRYTSLTAQHYLDRKLQVNAQNTILYLFVRPTIDLLTRVIRHKAILDGVPGIIFALFSALHGAIAFIKLKDLQTHV